MKQIELHTDGACAGNPGPGGWGTILVYNGHEKEISGGSPSTTNNQMELQAVIEGLKLLKEPCKILIRSDSNYVLKGISEWLPGWQRNNWRNSAKKPVKNSDLWKEYLELSKDHEIEVEWVKGHSGDIMNDRCDLLAVIERDKNKS